MSGRIETDVVPNYTNEYLNLIIMTRLKLAKDNQTADAKDYFRALMAYYVAQAGMFRHHSDDANKCLSILVEQEQKPAEPEKPSFAEGTSNENDDEAEEEIPRKFARKDPGIVAALKFVNEIAATIVADKHFATLLNTFFSCFPEYFPEPEDNLIKLGKAKKLDLWQEDVTTAIRKFIAVHSSGNGTNDHAVLQDLAIAIPTQQLADEYAAFLLKEALKDIDRDGPVKGTYKGWIYAALGKLSGRLSPKKQAEVNGVLLSVFFSDPEYKDISTIGLCEALANINPKVANFTLSKLADYLYTYLSKNLEALAKNADSYPQTFPLYLRKAFDLLVQLKEHFKLPDTRIDSLVRQLLKNEYRYTLREQLVQLESWISPSTRLALLKTLPDDNHFLEMATTFWHWLRLDHSEQAAELRKKFNAQIRPSRMEISGVINHDTAANEHMRFLVAVDEVQLGMSNADIKTLTVAHVGIIDNLINELIEDNTNGTQFKVRNELHKTLVTGKEWTSRDQRFVIAELLAASSCKSKYEINDDIRLSAACAAAEYSQCLRLSVEKTRFINDMLPFLDGPKARIAAEALRAFASNTNQEDLPQFMTMLMTKKSEYAQLLLIEMHGMYQNQGAEYNHRVRYAA